MARSHQFSVASLLLAMTCLAIAFGALLQVPQFNKPQQLFVCLPLISAGFTGAIGALSGRFWLFLLCGLLLPLFAAVVMATAWPMV